MLKNNLVIFGVIVLSLTVELSSCESKVPKETEYRLLDISKSIPLFEQEAVESPQMTCKFNLLDAVGTEDNTKFFNSFLYDGADAAQYAQTVVDSLTASYLEVREIASLYNPPAASFNWIYIETMSFRKFNERGMVIERETYSYTGGAHGIPGKKYYTVDLEARKVFNLYDFFRESEGERLRNVVIEELRRYSASNGEAIEEGLPLSQGIFYTDDPPVSPNFFITDEGLGLCWDPYEIAPYVFGSIEIILPWGTIRPFLRQDAMEFLEKCGIYMFM